MTIYHTINGRRTEKKRVNMKVASNRWHTLRVDFQGSHFTVTYDGKKTLEWDDSTFQHAGKVGVWTKADSVTLFRRFFLQRQIDPNLSLRGRAGFMEPSDWPGIVWDAGV